MRFIYCNSWYAVDWITGYGATTFPALTESFTIEKNATLARYEAERLKEVVDGLVKGLEEYFI